MQQAQLIYHIRLKNINEPERILFKYIEIYYNKRRKYSANGWKAPAYFLFFKKCQTVEEETTICSMGYSHASNIFFIWLRFLIANIQCCIKQLLIMINVVYNLHLILLV